MGGENGSGNSPTFLKLQPNSCHTGVNRKCRRRNTREEGETERDGVCVCVLADTVPLSHQHLLPTAGCERRYVLRDVYKVELTLLPLGSHFLVCCFLWFHHLRS